MNVQTGEELCLLNDRGGQQTADFFEQEITDSVPIGVEYVEPAESAIEESINNEEFDLFFSHSSEDKQWVGQIMEKLKNEPYNLKCCHDSKDFTPGWTVIQNIEHFLQVCKKTVFVFSPDFIKSGWGKRELDISQALSAEKNSSIIIPVLYKECKLPISIRTMNYIDARCLGYDDVSEKIAAAFKAGPPLPLPTMVPPGYIVPPTYTVPDDTNGVRLAFAANATSKIGFSFQELAQEHIAKLRKMKITAPTIVYRHLAAQLNKTWMLKVHNLSFGLTGPCLMSSWISCIWVLLVVIIAGAVVAGQQLPYNSLVTYGTLGGFCSFVVAFVITLVILLFCFKRKQLKTATNILVDVNMKYHERHHVLTYFQERQGSSSPAILMIRYDLKPCKDYLKAMLRRRYRCQIEEENDDDNLQNDIVQQESYEELTRCLRELLPDYIKMLVHSGNDKIAVTATFTRHEVLNDLVCFCQFVEGQTIETRRIVIPLEEPAEETTVMRINNADDEDAPLLNI